MLHIDLQLICIFSVIVRNESCPVCSSAADIDDKAKQVRHFFPVFPKIFFDQPVFTSCVCNKRTEINTCE